MLKILIIGRVPVKKNRSRIAPLSEQTMKLFAGGSAQSPLQLRRRKFLSGYGRNPASMRHLDPRPGRCYGVARTVRSSVASLAPARLYGHEFLDPFGLFHLARVDVPLRVHPDRVDPVELAGVFSVGAERSQRLAAVAVKNPNVIVRSVGHVQILLLRVL